MTPTKTRRYVGHGLWFAAGLPLNAAVHRMGGGYWEFVLVCLALALLDIAHQIERHPDSDEAS